MRILAYNKQKLEVLALSISLGISACVLHYLSGNFLLEPLFLAILLGMVARIFIRPHAQWLSHTKDIPPLLIPIGVLLYGAINLDFLQVSAVRLDFTFLTFFVFLVFILATLTLATILGLGEKTAYLLTTGSTICGASAITIASQAVDAEADDVSVSIATVFLAGVAALFFVLPILHHLLHLSDEQYAVFAGAVLQFTGFVKIAAGNLGEQARALAISVKAIRYLGLLFLVPFFASMIKGKIYVPWFLWGFLIAGILFSFFQEKVLLAKSFMRPILDVLWSSAMAAIGLNTNLRAIFSVQGFKAFIVSLIGFLIAAGVFLLGLSLGMGS